MTVDNPAPCRMVDIYKTHIDITHIGRTFVLPQKNP